MRIAIPQSLPREEVRRRLKARSGEIVDFLPGGGLANVENDWIDEDHMTLGITAMGQFVGAEVAVEEHQMVVTVDLPPQLGFVGKMIEGGIRDKGTKLLK
ncbi:hypothetical protein [Novosphingobium lentum]|uniref:hypothetical protein n=1 Tax=Novosphingobium lentum TaxID=145287 RepID=UPI00082C065B|nr:hypothetical protein [Novosphingobium lentum]